MKYDYLHLSKVSQMDESETEECQTGCTITNGSWCGLDKNVFTNIFLTRAFHCCDTCLQLMRAIRVEIEM